MHDPPLFIGQWVKVLVNNHFRGMEFINYNVQHRMLQLLILTKASIPNIVNNLFRPNISLKNYSAFGASFQYINSLQAQTTIRSNFYLFIVNNRNTTALMFKPCLNTGVFVINFEHISHLFLEIPLKLAPAISFQFHFFHQMIALQKL